MGRQEKIQENTVYHQRMINLSEVEVTNQMYRGEQTDKKLVKGIVKAIVPQLVRDINSEVGAYTLESRYPEDPLDLQKASVKHCVQRICEANVEKHFKFVRHYLKQATVEVQVDSSGYGFQRRKANQANTQIIADIVITAYNVEDDLHIILEWCTDLIYRGETVFN